MAEIATSVLHNVGNVLNSVNVSVRVASDKLQRSPVGNLAKAVGMMSARKEDLGEFLTHDDRGRRIPEFLEAVSEALCGEQSQIMSEMESLQRNVEHIKEIVSVQQSHAKPGKVEERVCVASLIQDAMTIALASAKKNNIDVDRQLDREAEIVTDKHAVLQILVNLLSNARQAVAANGGDKRLTVTAAIADGDKGPRMRIAITDNGEGIPPENLTRIFQHGFTTRQEGHGFGLHASANTARRLGGALTAHSDGPGHGATFTLELPAHKEAAV
jgi:signal transduction histidine kinase